MARTLTRITPRYDQELADLEEERRYLRQRMRDVKSGLASGSMSVQAAIATLETALRRYDKRRRAA